MQHFIDHKIVFFDVNGKLVKEIRVLGNARDVQVNSRGEYLTYVSEEKAESDGRKKGGFIQIR